MGARGEQGRRARPRRRASRGSASVEYGLIVAMIGAVLCLGVGVAVKSMFQQTITCFLEQMNSSGTSPECTDAGGSTESGGGGDGTDGSGGGGVSVTPKASPSPSVTPSVTPSETPSLTVTS